MFTTTVPKCGSTTRGFTSEDQKPVTTYLSEFKDHLEPNNLQRFNDLIQTGAPNHELIETIDREITQASVHAENKCRKCKPAYWTQELHQLKLHHSVWCQLRSRLHQHLPVTHICIVHRADQLKIPITTDTTLVEAQAAIVRSATPSLSFTESHMSNANNAFWTSPTSMQINAMTRK